MSVGIKLQHIFNNNLLQRIGYAVKYIVVEFVKSQMKLKKILKQAIVWLAAWKSFSL